MPEEVAAVALNPADLVEEAAAVVKLTTIRLQLLTLNMLKMLLESKWSQIYLESV